MPQRKSVPPWLIYLLQVIGLIVLGTVATRLAPGRAFLDDLVSAMENPTATVAADHSSNR